MKHYKLPFNVNLERKYNDINIERYLQDSEEFLEERKERSIPIYNDVHIELGKFKTFDLDYCEIIDIALRYALGKQEFRKLAAQLIEIKDEKNKLKV